MAKNLAVACVTAIDIVGLLGVELFELADGTLLINELAPRPHNSGHYTIEACITSQFENHIRSILDWPLGDTSLRVPACAMVNIIGKRDGIATGDSLSRAAEIEDVALHIYGKSETRLDRKMGHVTVTASDPLDALERAELAESLITL